MTTVEVNKIVSGLSLLLSGFGTLRYLVFGHRILDDKDPFDIGITPFTANTIMLVIFYAALYVLQAGFWVKYVASNSSTNFFSRDCQVGNHFIAFNVLNFFWAMTFSRHWFIISELCVVANLIQLSFSLFVNKASKYQGRPDDLLLVHGATGALPYTWTIYLLFWNGAAMLGVQKGLFARIIANILIWNMLFIPLMYVVMDNDWMIGFAGSYLSFAVGLGQLFTKVFALQWIFAFTISAVLFVTSLVVAVGGSRIPNGEQEPLTA